MGPCFGSVLGVLARGSCLGLISRCVPKRFAYLCLHRRGSRDPLRLGQSCGKVPSRAEQPPQFPGALRILEYPSGPEAAVLALAATGMGRRAAFERFDKRSELVRAWRSTVPIGEPSCTNQEMQFAQCSTRLRDWRVGEPRKLRFDLRNNCREARLPGNGRALAAYLSVHCSTLILVAVLTREGGGIALVQRRRRLGYRTLTGSLRGERNLDCLGRVQPAQANGHRIVTVDHLEVAVLSGEESSACDGETDTGCAFTSPRVVGH